MRTCVIRDLQQNIYFIHINNAMQSNDENLCKCESYTKTKSNHDANFAINCATSDGKVGIFTSFNFWYNRTKNRSPTKHQIHIIY